MHACVSIIFFDVQIPNLLPLPPFSRNTTMAFSPSHSQTSQKHQVLLSCLIVVFFLINFPKWSWFFFCFFEITFSEKNNLFVTLQILYCDFVLLVWYLIKYLYCTCTLRNYNNLGVALLFCVFREGTFFVWFIAAEHSAGQSNRHSINST